MSKYLKPILYILSVLLFLGSVVWVLRFSHQKQTERVCNTVKISIDSQSEVFITEDEIIEHLFESNLHPTGHLTSTLNAHAIEQHLLQNSAIQDANVFFQLSGKVDIKISQRQPIVRVENTVRQQFYIGSDGCLMAMNPNHTARLLIANGHISEAFHPNQKVIKSTTDTITNTPMLNKIYELANYIRNDKFLNEFIHQIYINRKHEIELVSKVSNQLILLGDATNYEDQFERLEKFYTYGIQKVGWDAYSIINLKYDNQVVCTKHERQTVKG